MTEGYFGLQVRRIVLSSVLIICCCFAISKVGLTTTEIDDGYNAISENSLRAHLLFLASDLLEGREATTRGYDIAAEYAASVFRQQGLKMLSDRNGEDSFLQVFPVNEVVSRNNETLQVITSNNGSRMVKSFSNKVNFLMGQVDRTVSINAPVVFAGYGLVEKEVGYDDFAGIDVRDKVVVVMAHAPGEGDPNSYFYKPANRNRFFNGEEVLAKRKNAQERGALAILLAEDPLAKHSSLFTNLASNISRKPQNNLRIVTPRRRMRLINEESSRRPIPIIDISPSVVSALFEKTGKSLEGVQKQIATSLKPASFEMIGKQVEILGEVETKLLNTSNVVAMLEGTDPNLRNEYVIIGAHLDHEGTRDGYIWNGADDDSSGSAAVLELAAAFSRVKIKPRRSILFCLWGAEEKGLLGSEYFAQHPLVPLENISAVIQLDMIGRDVEPKPLQLEGKPQPKNISNYIFAELPLQSPDFTKIVLEANKTVGLEINLDQNREMTATSDHYSFFSRKIPSLSIDDGVFHPDYHQPSDTAEKINFKKVFAVTRLSYLVTKAVANSSEKLKWKDVD